MKIEDINVDIVEGKLLMAALAVLTTATETTKTLDEVLEETKVLADKMFEVKEEVTN